jgi:hypothetical protein
LPDMETPGAPIAKRSSDLNAKWMPAVGMAAGAAWLSVCLVAVNAAEPGRPSQGDVDKMLVEARTAIAAKDFDRANALVAQAEAAQPKYTLFHLGPTPALVRRELAKAQHSAGADGMSLNDLAANSRPYEPAAIEQPTDPFAARMAATHPTSLPASDVRLASGAIPGRGVAPVVPALHSSPVGEPESYVDQAATVEIEQYGSRHAAHARSAQPLCRCPAARYCAVCEWSRCIDCRSKIARREAAPRGTPGTCRRRLRASRRIGPTGNGRRCAGIRFPAE